MYRLNQFECNFADFDFCEGLPLSRNLYITKAGVKYHVTVVRCCTSLQYCYIFLILLDFSTSSVKTWQPLKPVLGVLRNIAPFQFTSITDLIKPSLQCSCKFADFNVSDRSFFSWYMILLKMHLIPVGLNSNVYQHFYMKSVLYTDKMKCSFQVIRWFKSFKMWINFDWRCTTWPSTQQCLSRWL
jgi:hypothetical protein